MVSNAFVMNLFAESCKIRYSLGVYLIYMKILAFFNFFVLTFQTMICQIYDFFRVCWCDFLNTQVKSFQMEVY